MFTVDDLKIVQKALAVQRASFVRLSNRAGQPSTVVSEYIRCVGDVDLVAGKVVLELGKVIVQSAVKK